MKNIWPFAFYFFYYAALAYFAPFIVLFYQELMFSGAQIAVLAGIPPLITLVGAPFLTNLADARHHHRLVMSLGIGVAVVAVLFMQYMDTFPVILLTVILLYFFYGFFANPIPPRPTRSQPRPASRRQSRLDGAANPPGSRT